ncbi:hypothetical protein EW146_g4059 [Bondarzewia mesenterica]|uniref:Uncharacterized protein n=1 Tax=Bondarzewia mesenterica TaxID=1095465 RepID=A0A4S4LVL4_9AGAM|nr:hypothetical protein EW146_g4059 [Bondarzewia mesenterica]
MLFSTPVKYGNSSQPRSYIPTVLEEVKPEFLPPEEAPGHDGRAMMVATLKLRIEDNIVRVTGHHGML